MKVKQVMKKNIIRVPLRASLKDVAKVLFKHQVSGVLVTDEQGKLVGIISEKDVYRELYPNYKDYYKKTEMDLEDIESRVEEVKDLKAEDFMIKEVETVSAEDTLMKAGAVMLAKKINRLPVMENNQLAGIVSRKDIYQKILKTELGFKL